MSWLDSIADLQAKVAALTAENERLRAEAKEFDEMHQAFLAENLEEYANFAWALGLPEYVQGNELPGYPHILAAIKDITARTRALEAALKSARYRFRMMRVAEVLPGEEAAFCRYVQAEAKYGTESADAALAEPTPRS